MENTWEIKLLGSFLVTKGDCTVRRWRSQRATALFIYLALHPDRVHDRDVLVTLIWGHPQKSGVSRPWEPKKGRKYLSEALSDFRKVLHATGPVLICDRETVQLVGSAIDTDVQRFRCTLRKSEQVRNNEVRREYLLRAIRFYKAHGPLVPGLTDAWAIEEREALDEEYKCALKQYVALAEPVFTSTGTDASQAERDFCSHMNAKHVVQLLAEASHLFNSPEQARWFRRLDAEQQSVLAAIEWEMRQNTEPKLLTNATVRNYWAQRGHLKHVRRWLEDCLSDNRRVALVPRPFVIRLLGSLCVYMTHYRQARAYLEVALDRFQEKGDLEQVLATLRQLTWEAESSEDFRRMLDYNTEAQRIRRELRHEKSDANLLVETAWAYTWLGNGPEAMRSWEEAIQEAQTAGDEQQLCLYHLWYAVSLAHLDRPAAIAEQLHISLRMAEKLRSSNLMYHIHRSQGLIGESMGDLSLASRHYALSLLPALDQGTLVNFTINLRAHLRTAAGLRLPIHATAPLTFVGDLTEASAVHLSRLAGNEAKLRRADNIPLLPFERPVHDASLHTLTMKLGEDSFRKAFKEGQTVNSSVLLQSVRS